MVILIASYRGSSPENVEESGYEARYFDEIHISSRVHHSLLTHLVIVACSDCFMS